jgi:hypothetical protein
VENFFQNAEIHKMIFYICAVKSNQDYGKDKKRIREKKGYPADDIEHKPTLLAEGSGEQRGSDNS